MQSDKIEAIEIQMHSEAMMIIAEERNSLDQVDNVTRMQLANILGYGNFGIDAWLVSPCSFLGGERPLDLLPTNREKLIAAATHKSRWVNPA